MSKKQALLELVSGKSWVSQEEALRAVGGVASTLSSTSWALKKKEGVKLTPEKVNGVRGYKVSGAASTTKSSDRQGVVAQLPDLLATLAVSVIGVDDAGEYFAILKADGKAWTVKVTDFESL